MKVILRNSRKKNSNTVVSNRQLQAVDLCKRINSQSFCRVPLTGCLSSSAADTALSNVLSSQMILPYSAILILLSSYVSYIYEYQCALTYLVLQ